MCLFIMKCKQTYLDFPFIIKMKFFNLICKLANMDILEKIAMRNAMQNVQAATFTAVYVIQDANQDGKEKTALKVLYFVYIVFVRFMIYHRPQYSLEHHFCVN